MKTSSLILIMLIFTCLITLISIPLALRHRLATQNYTRINSDQSFAYDRQSFKNVRVLSLSGLSFCTIIPSDSLAVDLERHYAEKSENINGGDTLEIVRNRKFSSQRVRIFIPQNVLIEAKDCDLVIRGGLDNFDSLVTEIKLLNSHLRMQSVFKDEKVPQFWDQLTLIGMDSSVVEMHGNIIVRQLKIHNLNNVKMGERISVKEMNVSFDHRKRVYSSSNEDGLIIKAY